MRRSLARSIPTGSFAGTLPPLAGVPATTDSASARLPTATGAAHSSSGSGTTGTAAAGAAPPHPQSLADADDPVQLVSVPESRLALADNEDRSRARPAGGIELAADTPEMPITALPDIETAPPGCEAGTSRVGSAPASNRAEPALISGSRR